LVVREIRLANGFTTGFENTILAALTLRAVKDSAKKSGKLIKGAKEIYYPGTPHGGLTATHQDQVNADLLGLPPEAGFDEKSFLEQIRRATTSAFSRISRWQFGHCAGASRM